MGTIGKTARGRRAGVMLLATLAMAGAPGAPLPAALPGNATVAQGDPATGVERPLAAMMAKRDREMLERRQATERKSSGINILSTVVGAGVGLLCGAGNRRNGDVTRLACTAAGVAAAYATSLLGKGIAKKLKERDQQKVLAAAGDSLRSGEPQALQLPDSSATASVTPSGAAVMKQADIDIFYDTVRLAELSPVQVIASPYMATKANTILRATPSAKGKPVGRYAANQPLYVTGQVDGQPWYMVSERVVESDNSAMMAVGYVAQDQLKPAAQTLVLPGKAPPSTIASASVKATLRCDTLGMEVRDAKGKTTKGTSLLCLGPEGNTISA